MIYKISKRNAGIGIITMNIVTIVIFLLVIFKVLPYNIIGGGRLGSYQSAYKTAITSIVIISFGIPLVAIASGLIKFHGFKTFFKIYLRLCFAYLFLNTVANLLGTTLFEKVVMTTITVIQVILFFRLATDKEYKSNSKFGIK